MNTYNIDKMYENYSGEIERMKKMWENPPLCPHHLKLLFWCKKMGDKRFFWDFVGEKIKKI